MIAKEMKVPLYSDDSVIRSWASNEYRVETFSTISLLNRLTQKGNIKVNDAVELLANMIRKNYVFIPFNINHLNISLQFAIKKYFEKNKKLLNKTELLDDEILGAYISQFGNTSYDYQSLLKVATDWWIVLIENADFSEEIVRYCIESISYRLSMHTKSTILGGISKDEHKIRYAGIWMMFLLKAVLLEKDISKAWSTVKSVCEALFTRSEGDFSEILFQKIPKMFIEALEKNKEFDDTKKIETVFKFTSPLPSNDKEKVELYIQKNKPNFMR
ncbi:MAG: hypothetical protein AB1610_00405 [Nitrospirota bacterium]